MDDESGMVFKIDPLKELYQRFSRGDPDGAADVWTDDVVGEYRASGIPGSGGMKEEKRRVTLCSSRSVNGTSSS